MRAKAFSGEAALPAKRMQIHLEHPGSYATARIDLAPGERVKAESGAMMGMSGDLTVETRTGGLLKGLKRAVMGGESFFQNTFTAGARGGYLWLAPALPGDVIHTRLAGNALIVQDGSYLASAPEIDVDTRFQGARGFFSGEGFVMLRVSGTGDLLLSSYGAIDRHDLGPGQEFRVDTGHLVAFTEGMHFDTQRIGGLKTTLFSGEGVVSAFRGPGTVWTQSRSNQAFLNWLAQRLPGGGGSSGGSGGLGGLLGQ